MQLQYNATEGSTGIKVCVRVTAASDDNTQMFTVMFDSSADYNMGATATLGIGKLFLYESVIPFMLKHG